MKVAVLGCGPAGLAAAHAADFFGATVDIYSEKRKSHLFGAQYLHQELPGIPCGDPVKVSYLLRGSIQQYRDKVYGARYTGPVSPEDYEGDHLAYDIRAAYDVLWDAYHPLILQATITPSWLVSFLPIDYDFIFSSIPASSICVREHEFKSQKIWALGDAPERGQIVEEECPGNTVLCSGYPSDDWYRISNIFGYKTVEWPRQHNNAALVRKPISNDCDCWPDISRVGRFGEWRKGVLVSDAFNKVIAKLGG